MSEYKEKDLSRVTNIISLIVTAVCLFMSLAGIIITVGSLEAGEKTLKDKIFWFLAINIVVILSMLFLFIRLYIKEKMILHSKTLKDAGIKSHNNILRRTIKDVINEKNKIEKVQCSIAKQAHRIIHKNRYLIEMFTDFLLNPCERKELDLKRDTYDMMFKKHLQYTFLRNITRIFHLHTGYEVRSCLKMLQPYNNNPNVIQIQTYVRDSGYGIPQEVQELDGKWHTLGEDNVVMDTFKLGHKFHCNDINKECPKFTLSDELYRESLKYNSIIITPIRSSVEIDDTQPKIIYPGVQMLVVVHSKDGQFDKDLSFQILAALTDSLYELIVLMFKISERLPNN